MSVKHTKVNAGTAGSVVAADWNATHTIDPGTIGTTELAVTAVTPGAYTNLNATIAADGRVTAASNGSATGISGLTANTIPKAATSTTIGNSQITDNGTTITLPGQVAITGTATVANIIFGSIQRQTPVALTSSVAVPANTETQVIAISIPANTLVIGSTFTIVTYGTLSANTTAATMNMRFGATTLTGAIVAGLTSSMNVGGLTTEVTSVFTVRSIGATGTAVGIMKLQKPDPSASTSPYDLTARSYTTAPVTINTTVTSLLEQTFNTGTGVVTYSVHQGFIRQEL